MLNVNSKPNTATAGSRPRRQNTIEHPRGEPYDVNVKSQPPRAWIKSKQGNQRQGGVLHKLATSRLMCTGRPKNGPLISC